MTGSDAVLFDVDGTLVDSTYHHALAWSRALRRHGLAVPMSRIHRAIGMGGDRIVGHLTDATIEEGLGDALRSEWREEYAAVRHEVSPLPGAVELLGVGDVVELLTTAEDVDDSKPEPDLLTTTLEQLGGIERAVLVGDTVYDVESAARAGLACVALLSGGIGRDELLAAGAVRTAELPDDLVDVDWTRHLTPLGSR